SSPLPTGGYLEQADGTAWMAFFALCMLRISVELYVDDPFYEEFAVQFFQHFVWIAHSMNNHVGMWDEEDGFFYDVLRLPDGSNETLRVRSIVGLLPIAAAMTIEPELVSSMAGLRDRATQFMDRHPELRTAIHRPGTPGQGGNVLLSLLSEDRL